MALAREHHTVPETALAPQVKNFLGRIPFGRLGLRIGAGIRPLLRKVRDPIQHKAWIRQFVLPLRNAVLLNRPLAVSFCEIPVFLAPQGSTAGNLWAGLCRERHDVSFVLGVLEPGMTFFDVGASAGLLAISAAKKLGGKGVFAFDACSSTCELLKRNLRLNDLSGVHVAQIAFSDSAGEGTLQLNARGRDGLNTLGQATHPDSRVVAQEKVRIATVDAFLKEHKIARVDVMKIDVQGAELRVLRGAQKLLERDDAPVLVYEGYGHTTRGFGYHPVEILWFLESCGYSFLSLNDLTGEISELKPDYQYDSTVIAAKPAHPAFEELRGRLK